MTLAFIFIPPLIAAIILGFRTARILPETRVEFFKTIGFAIAWAALICFAWQVVWVSAALPAPWYDTMRSAANLTMISTLIWLPVLVITYIARALKVRAE